VNVVTMTSSKLSANASSAPATSAEDAIHDLALCEAIIRFVQDPRPITDPSAISALASAN